MSGGCENIDECSAQLSLCSSAANCTDTEGSYACQCQDGYLGDGFTCDDRDECSEGKTCGENATCVNLSGGFACECPPGFEGDGYSCFGLFV